MSHLRKIVVATALIASSSIANAANVLVVLSDSNSLELQGGEFFSTGFYLNELMQPVKLLMDAGDEITFATPLGHIPTMDKHSASVKSFGGDQQAFEEHLNLLQQLKLTDPEQSPVISLSRVEQIGYDHYDAVFVPGGHAPMQDLSVSPEMGKLLRAFHAEGKPTALICHGPIALISALPDAKAFTARLESNPKATDSGWIYSGYKMVSFTNNEEQAAKGMFNGGQLKFTPETALTNAGAQFQAGDKWASHVVVDRELITGQNPSSALELGSVLVQRLSQ
jgi:putative intracellular protease/amidase